MILNLKKLPLLSITYVGIYPVLLLQAKVLGVSEHGDEQHREDRELGGAGEFAEIGPDPELHRGADQR